MGLLTAVVKHVGLGDDSKNHAIAACPLGGSVPFGIVDGYHSTITTAHLALYHTLFFGFDFNQLGSHSVVSGAICDQKIWDVVGCFACEWVAIGYCYAFTGPLQDMIIGVTNTHEAVFPP